jgi:hypothetical protein
MLKVKVSGDGGKMSRLTNFVVISFSVLNGDNDMMSSKGMLKIILIYIIYCSVLYIWVLYAELLYTQGLSVLRVIDTGPYFFQLKMVCKVVSLLIS